MSESGDISETIKWYVMRDLKRHNAKEPAYKLFESKGIEFFTPMKWLLVTKKGKRTCVEVPFIPDLLFVRDSKQNLDSIVKRTETLQYRYIKGGYCVPMVVPDADMERFIRAVKSSESPKYFLPEELTPQMCGRKIRIVGGPLDTYEGCLFTTRGSKVKRLVIKLGDFFAAGVEVNPEFIELLQKMQTSHPSADEIWQAARSICIGKDLSEERLLADPFEPYSHLISHVGCKFS